MDNHRLITTVLGWLWTVVTGPVLDRLDGARRVWWCPTGYLALFPVHAATDPATGESALDRVVSSYTPTLRALLTARERIAPASADVLVVAVPRTPGAPDLDVLPEVKAIVDGVHGRPTVLIGPDATYDQVREQLPRHSWVHFACHGAQNLSARRKARCCCRTSRCRCSR
jgi:hypothetical protein